MKWRIRRGELDCSRTLLMGILNVTPDSFSDGGRFAESSHALQHAKQLIEDSADIVDLGAESTRPGADPVDTEEELRRLVPVIEAIRKFSDIPISIDTTKAEVARRGLELGADIINDVSGLHDSGPAMAEVVRDFGAGLVLMHRRGDPKSMQSFARYGDVTAEVLKELEESLGAGLAMGIAAEQIAVDPGIGFAKTVEQNIEIIRNLDRFHSLGRPVVLGHSRKSFIGQLTGRGVVEREFGTAAVNALAVLKGIPVLRVHDVRSARDTARVIEKIRGDSYVRTF